MLPLDSPRWENLKHADGSAADVPQWLSQLRTDDADEAMSDLVTALTPDNSIYAAAFAAVPHVVRISPHLRARLRVDALEFTRTVAVFSKPSDLSAIDDDIKCWYDAAIKHAGEIALKTFLTERNSPETCVYLLSAIAAFKNCTQLGKVLSGFVTGEFNTECPKCNQAISVFPEKRWFRIKKDEDKSAADDRVDVASVKSPVHVEPLTTKLLSWDSDDFSCDNSFTWLANLAVLSRKPALVQGLRHLYGWAICPGCQSRFSLMQRLLETA